MEYKFSGLFGDLVGKKKSQVEERGHNAGVGAAVRKGVRLVVAYWVGADDW